MNNPQSDGNENVIDIFVLGESEAATLELNEQLENQDYRVTHFTDGQELISTLRSGRPNLIICDTTTFGQEAYDYCRQIKSDDTLWMIPVMILTRASSLSDLLNVLDSNGDNFIAQPYDFPYLLSLIEGMLASPVERLTSDQIKTQFKIQHDDKIFVVTADRRKLLEFLLSAFEIAVKNSEDLSTAQAELQVLSSRITILEDAGIDNARVIGMLNTDIRKKELEEHSLKGDLEEIEKALDEKTAEAAALTRAMDENKILLTTTEDHVRMLLAEKEKTASCNLSETTLLTDQITALSQEISLKATELNTAQHALEGETACSSNLDLALKKSKAHIEQLETSLQALTLEHADRTSELSAEKKRADAAELETKSVLLAKTQAEEELTHHVDEMKDSVRKQNDEILGLKTALEAEKDRFLSAETRFETLRHEMEQLKVTNEVQEESHQQQLEDLQSRLDAAMATIFSQERELQILKDERIVAHADEKTAQAAAAAITAALNETRAGIEEREWKIQSLEKEIADIGLEKAAGEEKFRTLTKSLEDASQALRAEKEQHAAIEEHLNAAIRERDAALQSVQEEHERTKADLDLQKNHLAQMNRDLESAALLRSTLQGDITQASSRIKELEHELNSAVLAKDQTGEQIRELAEELERTKSAFDDASLALSGEKEAHTVLREELDAAIRDRDAALQSVQGAHELTKADLDLHKNNMARLNQDLEAAALLRSTLEKDNIQASSRIKGLEHELNSAVQEKDRTGEQIRDLAEELERTKAAFDEVRQALSVEKEAHTVIREELDAAIRERDATLHSVMGTHEQTKSDLDLHKKNLLQLNQDLDAANRIYSVLLADFKDASSRIDELESELKSAGLGKEQASEQARSLADDLGRAKAELEAERRIRQAAEMDLQAETQVTGRLKGDIVRSTAEREGLVSALEQERRLHHATVEQVRAAALAKEQADLEFTSAKEARERQDGQRAADLRKFSQDLELILARQHDLEQKVQSLESEKATAEARAEALSDEIQQARIALADEWEDHMNDEERLAATE
ncbi:MAG: response regulator, partial [Methanomicrobiales archaeon]